jgi:hypothetical protein
MKAIAVAAVTVGFVWLLGQTLAYHWSPLFLCAYVVISLGWELYARCALDEARYRRQQRQAKGLCLRCGYDLTGNLSNVCPDCGDGDRTDPTVAAYHEPLAATAALCARAHRFRERPCPTDWSQTVAGVALGPFTLRVYRSLVGVSRLPQLCRFKLSDLRANGEPQATAADLYADLNPILRELDRVLPALPPEAREYFADLRCLSAEAAALAETWWRAGAQASLGGVDPQAPVDSGNLSPTPHRPRNLSKPSGMRSLKRDERFRRNA